MVLLRRLEYGFSGYEVPVVPRASRSARGRVPVRKKYEANAVRAFEILASLAGELLQETGSSAPKADSGKVKKNIDESIPEGEQDNGDKCLKANLHELGTFAENTFLHVPRLQGSHHSYSVNEFSNSPGNFALNINSRSKFFDWSEKTCFAERWPHFNGSNASRSRSGIVGRVSPHFGEIFRRNVDSQNICITQSRQTDKVCSAQQWSCFSKRSASRGAFVKLGEDASRGSKPPPLGSCESSLRASLFMGCTTFGPLSRSFANLQADTRDDEETSLGYSQFGKTVTAYKPLANVVDQRVRNLSAARCWTVAPKLRGGSYSKTDWKRNKVYGFGRPHYTRQRSQRISSFKRRKLFDQIPTSRYNSPYKRSNGAKGASPSAASQQAPPKSKLRESIVKLHIKSFKIPELFIEIPGTATVGSLKRMVMEAATDILGDDLHVGIVLQGKTVRDDSKTLLQTGICHDDRHRNLDFMLEPKSAQLMPPLHTDDSCLLSSGMPQDPTGHSVPLTSQPESSDVPPLPQEMNTDCHVDSNINAICSLADIPTNNTMRDSQALVAVPAITMEALAIVPFHKKSRHSEIVQRRARRPFSVSEVEALVQAVEKLGTGRWHDVKLRAFDNAKHRTYVDLKDKWKTLVHTARISPQKRRGEPLPQQLLDRVLAAHAYWSGPNTRPINS